VNDPYLGATATLGACRPDIREMLQKGDHIFAVSGKVRHVDQVVLGGFEIAEKISAMEAYERFPEQRLRLLPNGQVTGNVIVTANGEQHELDDHNQFARRIQNYIVGTNPVALLTPEELAEGRYQTLEILRDVFLKNGNSIRELIGRCRNLEEEQILKLRALLHAVKNSVRKQRPVESLRGLTIAARVPGPGGKYEWAKN
jgi:hypothetical protein